MPRMSTVAPPSSDVASTDVSNPVAARWVPARVARPARRSRACARPRALATLAAVGVALGVRGLPGVAGRGRSRHRVDGLPRLRPLRDLGREPPAAGPRAPGRRRRRSAGSSPSRPPSPSSPGARWPGRSPPGSRARRGSRPARLVLAFAATTAVVRWDRSVLTESLAMSTCALLLAALLWAFDRTTWPRVARARHRRRAVRGGTRHRRVDRVGARGRGRDRDGRLPPWGARRRRRTGARGVRRRPARRCAGRGPRRAQHRARVLRAGLPVSRSRRLVRGARHARRRRRPRVRGRRPSRRRARRRSSASTTATPACSRWCAGSTTTAPRPSRGGCSRTRGTCSPSRPTSPSGPTTSAAGASTATPAPERTELVPVDAVMTPNAWIVLGLCAAAVAVILSSRRPPHDRRTRRAALRRARPACTCSSRGTATAWRPHATPASATCRRGSASCCSSCSRPRSSVGRLARAARCGPRRVTAVRPGYIAPMATYEDIPPPEPKEIDEQNWLQLKDLIHRSVLKGHPYEGKEQCDNCLYYLDPDDDISYCWHPTLRILVGGQWWCQWWEAGADRLTHTKLAMPLHSTPKKNGIHDPPFSSWSRKSTVAVATTPQCGLPGIEVRPAVVGTPQGDGPPRIDDVGVPVDGRAERVVLVELAEHVQQRAPVRSVPLVRRARPRTRPRPGPARLRAPRRTRRRTRSRRRRSGRRSRCARRRSARRTSGRTTGAPSIESVTNHVSGNFSSQSSTSLGPVRPSAQHRVGRRGDHVAGARDALQQRRVVGRADAEPVREQHEWIRSLRAVRRVPDVGRDRAVRRRCQS